jgi:drug/metabolite transporter (DMT)-like permease
MAWFLFAVAAYFLFAVVNLTDKFLIDNVLKSSKTYSFIVCLLSSLVFLISPWFLHWPGIYLFLANMITGALFAAALYFLYEALSRGEAARTVILIGGMISVFSTIASFLMGESFYFTQLLGVIFLLIGIFLIAYLPDRHSFWEKIWSGLTLNKKEKISVWLILLSSIFYSAFFVSTKLVYSNQDFWSAFIWVRLGALFSALLFLLDKKSRLEIFDNLGLKKKKKKKSKKNNNVFLFLFNQGLGSAAFILQNYAIFLGPVAIINSLQGVQYALMLFFAFFLGFYFKEYKEKFSWPNFSQKLLAVIIISLGLYLISINL